MNKKINPGDLWQDTFDEILFDKPKLFLQFAIAVINGTRVHYLVLWFKEKELEFTVESKEYFLVDVKRLT